MQRTRLGAYDFGNGWYADRDTKGRWVGFETTDGADDSPIYQRTAPYKTLREVRAFVTRHHRQECEEAYWRAVATCEGWEA